MLTTDGLQRLWQIAAGTADDRLVGGRIVVSDGDAEASVEIHTVNVDIEDETAVARLSGTFGETEGVFTWTQVEVRTHAGIVLDRSPVSQGMKVLGSEWTVRVALALRP